jgi:UDP-N-acetylglucosamine--N-acetylmuramyl-(pentapeptide) pyrophosphoryl-undecaprenol N-acetylglucosamine transferase
MKIVFVGGGTGGHFYPLIAVAEAIEEITDEKTLIEPELFYIGPPAFDAVALAEHNILHLPSPAGKMRRYPSLLNIIGFIPTAIGIFRSVWQLFFLYPDVIFSTGGYTAFPTLYAARILKIPVVIYDADATPGRVSLWSAKFARWIAVAHPDAALKFPQKLRDRIARVGHPIRKEILTVAKEGGHEFLKLDPTVPTLFVTGGSQGARAINEVLIDTLQELVTRYNIVHQTGVANLTEVAGIASVVLKDSPFKERYRPFGLLNALAMRMATGVTSLVIARAGSGTIFEVASWGIPAILVPIPLDVSHDQTENAFSYARHGGGIVIEQHNLSQHVLLSEIDRLMNDAALRSKMSEAARAFARPDAAHKVAQILVEMAIAHEPV